MTRTERIERNLRLYPAYQALRSSFFWLPVFFLYFLQVLSLEEALLLEAIYYVTVVVLEVPSGWVSDRLGRRPTLLAATAATTLAALVFAGTASFAAFALAQGLKAAGQALNSGTDTSLLYDSLAEAGREGETAEREGRALAWGLGFGAGAAAVGGLVGLIDLRLAWLLTAAGELGAFGVALAFAEPRPAGRAFTPERPVARLLAHLRDPALTWLFVFSVAMVVLNHVPFEFFQPFVALVVEGAGARPGSGLAPPVAGAVAAVMMALGAVASRRAARTRTRLGVRGSLLAAMAVQIGIIGAMAGALHPAVLAAIVLRNVPMGLAQPIVLAEVHPRLRADLRATYLSVQSLVGRLAFAGLLALASRALAGEATSHAAIAPVLGAFAAGGVAVALLLAVWPRAPGDAGPRGPATPAGWG